MIKVTFPSKLHFMHIIRMWCQTIIFKNLSDSGTWYDFNSLLNKTRNNSNTGEYFKLYDHTYCVIIYIIYCFYTLKIIALLKNVKNVLNPVL